MKRLGIDQSSAWLFSLILSVGLFAAAYILLGKIVKNPSDIMREKIAKHEGSEHDESTQHHENTQHEESTEAQQTEPESSKHESSKHGEEHGEDHSKLEGGDEKSSEDQSMAGPTWSYAGRTGPDYWSDLDDSFADCQVGREQSPVDLNNAIESGDLQPVELHYQKAYVSLVNDSHTLVGRHEPGSYMLFQDQRYKLVQFLFHLPSEHTVDGIPFDMELQLIHQNDAGKIATLSVFMEEGGIKHPGLEKIWTDLPQQGGESGPEQQFNVEELLPRSRSYFTYTGSLSTPPCTQGVNWLIFTQPIKISSNQIEKFIKIYRNNSRPVQGINKRTVYLSANR